MAVVQISRIQQRRGKKNTGTGFPQLASGEIGWAIDTQELYIGNGSVSEGSPYVGNTQILTEHVNILDFAEAYQYRRLDSQYIQTGVTSSTPVERTIQERLDETVSILSFIPKNKLSNGKITPTQDLTQDLQRAIDQLFLNSTSTGPSSKVVLYLEPGEYTISSELRIPPFAHIVGAGIDSTIINLTGTTPGRAVMRMVDGQTSGMGSYTPFASMTYLQRPRFIYIEGMTLKTNIEGTIVLLDNTDSSVFERVKFVGKFVNNSQPILTNTVTQTGILIRSSGETFQSDNVQFRSCIWEETGFGVYSDTYHNAFSFQDCKFYRLYDGLALGYKHPTGGNSFDANNTKVTNCYFDLIDRFGIWIKKGKGNTSSNNKFINVGNNNGDYGNATFPNILFDDPNNQSVNDYFERNTRLKNDNLYGAIGFVPCVKTTGLVVDPTNFRKILDYPQDLNSVDINFFRFPLFDSATYVIDYVIHKNVILKGVRTGRIHLTVDLENNDYHIQDDFTYSGDVTLEYIQFSAALENLDTNTGKDTLVLKIKNSQSWGYGTMNYSYCMLTR